MNRLEKSIKYRASSEKTLQAGKKYYKEGKVKQFQITGDAEYVQIDAEVEGNFKIPYRVRLGIQEGDVAEAYCECPAFHNYYGLCKHIVATAYTFMEERKIWERQLATRTDRTAKELIEQFREKNKNEVLADASTGRIQLEVYLDTYEIDDFAEATVRLKLGEEKMYVLKDFTNFKNAMKAGIFVEYGKNLKFHHNIAAFVEEDRKMVNFFVNKVDEIDEYRYYRIGKEFHLSGHILDEFLNLCIGKKIIYIDREKIENHVLVKKENVKVKIEISKKNKEAYQMELKEKDMIQGYRHTYILKKQEKILYCCDSSYHKQMEPFFHLMYQKAVTISEQDMQLLYAEVLEKVADYVEFTEKTVDLEQFMPPEGEVVFYLDAPKTDKITCKTIMQYGEQTVNLFTENDTITYRDIPLEYQIKDILKRYLNQWDEKEEAVYCEEKEEQVYDFMMQVMPLLYEYGTVMATDNIKKMNVRHSPKLSVGVSVESDLLELKIDVEEYSTDVLKEMLHAYQKKKKYYRLKSGEFINLADEEFHTLSELVQGFQMNGKEWEHGKLKVPLYRALYLDKILKENERITYDRDTYFKQLVRNMKSVEDSDYQVPEMLKQVLRSYQKTGYRWLRTLDEYGFGGILADDMGLGKTLQVITFLAAKKQILWQENQENVKNPLALIVCPASLVYNWENEIEKFAPELSKKVLAGDAKERKEVLEETVDIFITSYDTLRRDISYYEGKKFYCQIVDEAQFIKNQTTQAAKAVKAIVSKVRFALTGTPIENRLSELWSIFDYLMPGYLYSYGKFKKELELPIVQENGEESLKRLQRMLNPFILRRIKKEVLKELPDKMEQVVYTKLEGEQRVLYTAAVHAMLESLKSKSEKEYQENKLVILAQLTKLRQICCAPELYYEDYKGEHAKVDTAMELIENAIESDHKILVFSQFAQLLEILETELQKKNTAYYMLTGKTGKEKRIAMVNEFNQNEIPVFLISLKAGGTGLNLTAADVVIHLDPWWNAAAQNQATDRAHRIGQKNIVSVFNLIAKDTIEEKILNIQEKKKDLTDQVLDKKDNALHVFSQKELIEILEN